MEDIMQHDKSSSSYYSVENKESNTTAAMSNISEDSINHCSDLGNSLHEFDHNPDLTSEDYRSSPVGCSSLDYSEGEGHCMNPDLACVDDLGGGFDDTHEYNKDNSGASFSCLNLEVCIVVLIIST
jgi:hypothetical protein